MGANPFVTGLVFGLCYLHRYNALVYLPAVLWFFLVVDRYRWRETGLFGAGALLVSLPWLMGAAVLAVAATSVGKGWNNDYEAIGAVNGEEIECLRRLPAGSVVVTDRPWELAWKADLISVLAPARYADFEGRLSGVDYVFFSGVPFEPAGSNSYRKQYVDNPKFNDEFALEKRFDGGGTLFVARQAAEHSANGVLGNEGLQE